MEEERKICSKCAYFLGSDDGGKPSCFAFLHGIPDEYLTGEKEHMEVDPRQKDNKIVYVEKVALGY